MSDSMASYARAAGGLARELAESLSSEDADALAADLRAMGPGAWEIWAAENHEEAIAFLRAEPAKRARRAAWRDNILRGRLTLAAHRLARLGAVMIEQQALLWPGRSWRDTAAEAAAAADRVVVESGWSWPFDADPPFEEWDQ